MEIKLFNSLTRRVETFTPLHPDRVTFYICGPTVYNYAHIGNARGPVVFGVLVDALRRHFGKVDYARNITDVDDKINAAALEQGVPIAAITDRFAAIYREDMSALGVKLPDIEPAATAHIPQMVRMRVMLSATDTASRTCRRSVPHALQNWFGNFSSNPQFGQNIMKWRIALYSKLTQKTYFICTKFHKPLASRRLSVHHYRC